MRSARRAREKREWSYLGIEMIPREIIGVYAFWCRDTGSCIYVGKAKDEPVKERLAGHWRESHNETLRFWIREFGDNLDICYMSVEPNRIDKFEDRLIKTWRPEANISQNQR